MIATREGAGTVLALVSFVACMKLDMTISASLVLEWPITIIAGVDCVWIMMIVSVVNMLKGQVAVRQLLVHQSGRGAC